MKLKDLKITSLKEVTFKNSQPRFVEFRRNWTENVHKKRIVPTNIFVNGKLPNIAKFECHARISDRKVLDHLIHFTPQEYQK